jgi:alkanesulfonate monooxygenase SsuD/methylene tetrahydromethanopterin reductase-like flavin-dependent oxidoreductase (luciferase family)
MKFGYYSQTKDRDNSRVYADLMDELREQVVFCEEAGFDIAYPDEHHFHFGYHENTNPIVAGAMLAAHTSRIRIGLPLIPANWQPLRLAEDIAMLDQMSRGRVEVDIGRGASRHSIANLNPELRDLWPNRKSSFNADSQAASREHFAEVVEILKKAWTEESFTHEGRFYKFPQEGLPWEYPDPPKDVSWARDGEIARMCLGPKPYQKPHPPLRMLVHSEHSYKESAQLGLKAWVWINPLKKLRERLETYSAIRTEREGRQFEVGEDVTALKLLYVAPSYEEAKRDADHIFTPFLQWFCTEKPHNYHLDDDEEPRPESELDWEFFRKRLMIIAGSPEQVAEQIHELDERFSLDTLALWTEATGPQGGTGLLDHKQIMSSLDLFASKVAPLFPNGI